MSAATEICKRIGSWAFVKGQAALIVGYVLINTISGLPHFDPYPFMLLNFFLSLQAACLGPIILMAQNLQSDRDRALIYRDLELSEATEAEIRTLVDIVKTNNHDVDKILDAIHQKFPTKKG